VFFISAENQVTRDGEQSFLTDSHIQRIVTAYQNFNDEGGFAKVVGKDPIQEKGCNLSIPLYVRNKSTETFVVAETKLPYGQTSLQQAIANWQKSSLELRKSMDELFEVLEIDYRATDADKQSFLK